MSSGIHSFEDALADLAFSPLTSHNDELFESLEPWSQHYIRYLTVVQAY